MKGQTEPHFSPNPSIIMMRFKFAAKAVDSEKDDVTDDKDVKKDKSDADKDGGGDKDTEGSDKKNNSAVSKPARGRPPANKKSNDDAAAAKKGDSGGGGGGDAKAKANDDDEDDDADDKQPNGTALGDIPKIDKYITSTRIDVLQTLHQICFDAVGKTNSLKKNLRQFEGFDFDKESDDYEKKVKETQKFELPKLKGVCEGLQLDKKGTKEAVSQRICEFLLAPTTSEDAGDEEDGEEEGELLLQTTHIGAMCIHINSSLNIPFDRSRRGGGRAAIGRRKDKAKAWRTGCSNWQWSECSRGEGLKNGSTTTINGWTRQSRSIILR